MYKDKMHKDSVAQLFHHWNSLREGKLPPFRSDISPREIPEALDTLFIIERLQQGDMRLRVAGLQICEMVGMEVRGLSPGCLFKGTAREQFGALLEQVVTDPVGAEVLCRCETLQRPRMILLPLRSDFGDVSRIVGCFSAIPAATSAPQLLDIAGVEYLPLQARRTAPPPPPRCERPLLRSIEGGAHNRGPAEQSAPLLKLVY